MMMSTSSRAADMSAHARRTRTNVHGLSPFSFSSQESVATVFGSPVHNREPLLSDVSDLRTDELMILRMRVIFQENEKYISQVLLNIGKCDNIKHTGNMFMT